MTEFSAETYQNEYLAVGATEVDAVVRVSASGGDGSRSERPDAAEIILVDVSGSMKQPPSKIRAAREATAAAIDCVRDGVMFGVVAGTDSVREVYPGKGALVAASEATRAAAKEAVSDLSAGGGTAMGRWLTCAAVLFAGYPDAIHHAILLTDGRNESELPGELETALGKCEGTFQCDCRGVGANWEVSELRLIASTLLGDVDVIRDPDEMAADFTEMMRRAMGRSVNDVALRVWTPTNATVSFVKQVAPEIEDLTERRVAVDERTGDYPTGAWGDEVRDYHVRIAFPARAVGEEMLAARLSLVVDDRPVTEAKIRALWTNDEALSTRLNPEVVRSIGQSEYAEAVQSGIAALRDGDDANATRLLGRAAQLADALGDGEKLGEVGLVVQIEDAATGTIRLRSKVDEADLIEADAHSTKTTRTKKLGP